MAGILRHGLLKIEGEGKGCVDRLVKDMYYLWGPECKLRQSSCKYLDNAGSMYSRTAGSNFKHSQQERWASFQRALHWELEGDGKMDFNLKKKNWEDKSTEEQLE